MHLEMNESRKYAALTLVLMESHHPRNPDECKITYNIHYPGDAEYDAIATSGSLKDAKYFVSMTLESDIILNTFIFSNTNCNAFKNLCRDVYAHAHEPRTFESHDVKIIHRTAIRTILVELYRVTYTDGLLIMRGYVSLDRAVYIVSPEELYKFANSFFAKESAS
jgi:hypothetical protein